MSGQSQRAVKRILVLGASGSVGRLIVEQALDRGFNVTAQTRNASNIENLDGNVQVVALDPTDEMALANALHGHDAVIFALGVKSGKTTLFSDATRALLPAMNAAGVPRLIAITGVGAGDTRGHGGFIYDRIIFPLFTRHFYEDKNAQEKIIEASGLDWVIVRPAPFRDKSSAGPLQALTRVQADTRLRRITRSEVARFVLDQLVSDTHLGAKVFIGHP